MTLKLGNEDEGGRVRFWGVFLAKPGEPEYLVKLSLDESLAREKLRFVAIKEGYAMGDLYIREVDPTSPDFQEYQRFETAREEARD